MLKTVVIGFLGSTLDAGVSEKRWNRWRPTVAACWQEDLPVDRYLLLYHKEHANLLDQVVADIAEVSPKTKVEPVAFSMEDPWDFEQVFSNLHGFVREQKFDADKERYLINITTGTHVLQICLFLLTESRYLPGDLLQLEPEKGNPRGRAKTINLDLAKYDPIAARFEEERLESQDLLKDGIATENEKFNKLIQKIELVALRSPDPILLMGRTGTGKTALARRIYQLKKSRQLIREGKLVDVNCATLKGGTVMSTLFGHKKGAFTGALSDRKGLLVEADKGLLFLDEIGELGLDEQAMLLRAIEEKEFLPVGADRSVRSDFQIIAGTNRDLRESVGAGEFREDLLARLDVWSFTLPELKERREDIPPNIDFELEKFARRTGKKIRFTKEALKEFMSYANDPATSWAGNFRDLNAAITRLGTLADFGKIDKLQVKEEIDHLQEKGAGGSEFLFLERYVAESVLGKMDDFDKPQLDYVLMVCESSKSMADAGRKLFSKSRETKKQPNDSDRLKKYLDRYELSSADLF